MCGSAQCTPSNFDTLRPELGFREDSMPDAGMNWIVAMIGALGTVGGGAIGYYSGANKDNATLVVELTRNVTTIEEKAKTIDLLISRGLLTGVSAETVTDILEMNASKNAGSVPTGLVCGGIWCSLRGQVENIQKYYAAAGYYSGPIDGEPSAVFTNATIAYQTDKKLAVDGIIGSRTFQLIRTDALALGIDF